MSNTRISNQEEASVAFESELQEPLWSVVSFEKREAAGLTYSEAFNVLNDLDERGIPGLCIVTDEAASRIKTPE